jgi:hypothetical protein
MPTRLIAIVRKIYPRLKMADNNSRRFSNRSAKPLKKKLISIEMTRNIIKKPRFALVVCHPNSIASLFENLLSDKDDSFPNPAAANFTPTA